MSDVLVTGYGVIRSVQEAQQAAQDAQREGLLGYYPAACVVLAQALLEAQRRLAAAPRLLGVPPLGEELAATRPAAAPVVAPIYGGDGLPPGAPRLYADEPVPPRRGES